MFLRAALGMLFCLLIVFTAKAAGQPAIAVYGIRVDVTSSDAVSAREKAVLAGQRDGLHQVITSLIQSADANRLPQLSDDQITDLVADYEVESEKVSTVRYIGQLTFRFRADAVASYLQQGGFTFVATPGPAVLILPVLTDDSGNQLWEDSNSWRAAWSQHLPADGLVTFRLPKGDASDAAVTADEVLAGDSGTLAALASRYGVSDVLVAAVRVDASGTNLSAKRYGATGALGGFEDKIAGEPDSAYLAAIDGVATQLQQDWIDQNRVSSGAEQSLTVDATVGGLAQWAEMNRRLANVGRLRHVEVVYLMRSHAELQLVFIGDRDQLAQALSQQALLLQNGPDGRDTLSLAGGAQP
jgi:hypothetical protein